MTQGREPNRSSWKIRDAVTRLRVWGSDECHELSTSTALEYWLDSSSFCEVPVTGSASHRYAQMSCYGGVWTIRRLDRAPVLLIDGDPRDQVDLTPGMEINTGALTFVAESERSINLRCFLSRLLGWGKSYRKEVDRALRRIRSLQLQGLPIVLQGEGSLVPLAHDLHYYLHPIASPFVACDPHSQSGAASAAPPLNIEGLESALMAAAGGSLCIRNERPPEGLESLSQKMGDAPQASQVIICDDRSRPSLLPEVEPIVFPSLTTRAEQVEHIIFEYALDVCAAQGAALSQEDRAWIKAYSSASLGQICEAATRLAALQVEGEISRAAERLNMSQSALRRWLRLGGPLPGLSPSDMASVESLPPEPDA